MMKLTVLGNNGPYPKAGGACSGYLIESDHTKILLDCGNGVLSNLQKVCDLGELDAIILSHLHPDHISDVFVLRYALFLNSLSLPIYAPEEPFEEFNRLFYKSFSIKVIREEESPKIGDLKLKFKKLDHIIPSYATSICLGDKRFIYSGDTVYTEDLVHFSKGADVLLCEAGVLEKDLVKNPPHLSGKQAVEIANRASVKKLILTHFLPKYSIDMYKKETKGLFNSEIQYAQEMKTYHI